MEQKKLYKSETDRKLMGVCGGVAEYLGLDSTIVRLLWVLMVFFMGTGVLLYLVAGIIIPERPKEEKHEKEERW